MAGQVLGVIAGVAAGLIALVQRGGGVDQVRDWTRAGQRRRRSKKRCTSTSSLAAATTSPTTATAKLAQRADEIATAVADLLRLTAGIIPDGKPLPAVADATSYGGPPGSGPGRPLLPYRAAEYQRLVSRLQRVGAALGGLGGGPGRSQPPPGPKPWPPGCRWSPRWSPLSQPTSPRPATSTRSCPSPPHRPTTRAPPRQAPPPRARRPPVHRRKRESYLRRKPSMDDPLDQTELDGFFANEAWLMALRSLRPGRAPISVTMALLWEAGHVGTFFQGRRCGGPACAFRSPSWRVSGILGFGGALLAREGRGR